MKKPFYKLSKKAQKSRIQNKLKNIQLMDNCAMDIAEEIQRVKIYFEVFIK